MHRHRNDAVDELKKAEEYLNSEIEAKQITSDETYERSHRLIAMIDELSRHTLKQNEYVKWIDNLNEIYVDGFRHLYSQIYNFIKGLDIDRQGVLSYNIEVLYKDVNNQKSRPQCAEGLSKLYDHVSLELQRMEVLNAQISKSKKRYRPTE